MMTDITDKQIAAMKAKRINMQSLRLDEQDDLITSYDTLSAERDALQERVDAAPHTEDCHVHDSMSGGRCSCWKKQPLEGYNSTKGTE